MTTPTQTEVQDPRAELVALITAAANDLTTAWNLLPAAQDVLLRRLAKIRGLTRGSIAATRDAIATFNAAVAVFDRDARAVAERWAAQDLPLTYRNGAVRALHSVEQSATRFAWNTDHQAAITALTATYWADLIRRITEAVRRAQAFARAAQAAARTNDGVDSAALLDENPLDTVIYANQARHPVHAWARSALAWQGVVTTNTGAINVSRLELAVEWMEVRDGPECGWVSHSDTDHADGTLRTVEECETYPASHHGCIRQLYPRPDLTGRIDISEGDQA